MIITTANLYKHLFLILTVGIIATFGFRYNLYTQEESPLPPSTVIKSISYDWNTHIRRAPGSDLWPLTWAYDDALYTSWGDGGGFGGTNKEGRVSLGFGRIEGIPPELRYTNVSGGFQAENEFNIKGKSAGLIALDTFLYAFVNTQNKKLPDQRLYYSPDLGKTWKTPDWFFPGNGPFIPDAFLNYGKNYDGAIDDYVYIYGWSRVKRGMLFLARVKKQKILYKEAYEYLYGISDGVPAWTSDITRAIPILENKQGVGAFSVVFHPYLGRYLLTYHHDNRLGMFELAESKNPWGPWYSVAYYNDWEGLGDVEAGMPHSFPTKWISDDGLSMYMVFSGTGEWDSFNLIKATLTLHANE